MRSLTDQFLDLLVLESHASEILHKWPLSPGQIMLYFEMDQCIEMYDICKELRKEYSP